MTDTTPEVPDGHSHLQKLFEGNVIDAALKTFYDPMGTFFPFVAIAGTMVILWVWSDDIKLPTTVGVVMSGVVLTYIPSAFLSVIGGLFVFCIAVAVFSIWSGRAIGGAAR